MKSIRLLLATLCGLLLLSLPVQAVVDGDCNFTAGNGVAAGFTGCSEEFIEQVASVAALRAATATTHPGEVVNLLSWNAGLNKGGGLFWRSGTGGVDNGGTLIVDASSRNWYRIDPLAASLTPEMFGAQGGAADDTAELQAALDAIELIGGKLHLKDHYLLTATLTYTSSLPITIFGDASDNSALVFDVGAGVNGLVLAFDDFTVDGVPEVSGVGIYTKKASTIAGTALTISYAQLSAGSSKKGAVVANNDIDSHTSVSSTTSYWTNGIELGPYLGQNLVDSNFVRGRGGGGALSKTGSGIICKTRCQASVFRHNKVRGWGNAFLTSSTFADGEDFQFEGVSFLGNTFTNNDFGINIDLWDVETTVRISGNMLDNARVNVRLKNVLNANVVDNSMFHHDQLHSHTDVLIITTDNDAIGAPIGKAARTTISNNSMSRNSLENPITGITQANPAVLTYSGDDNWVNGDKVFLASVTGMVEVKNLAFTVANLNVGANTFTLRNEADTADINSTGYGAFTAGTLTGLTIGIDVQGGDNNLIAENLIQDRSIGIRLGVLVETVNINRNATIATFVKLLNNMTTTPESVLVGRLTNDEVLEEITLGAGLTITAGVLDTVGGGGGDSIRVEDGDDAGTFSNTADADFEDSGDIDFVLTGNDISGLIRPNSVTLTTDTVGNYADGDAQGGAALTGDSATGFFSVGTLEVARGGTGSAPGAADQALISDSTSGATWRAIPDSDGATQKLQYDAATNTFSVGTDADSGGDVDGPASATNNAIVRFDATSGKLIQDSGVLVTDGGEIRAVAGTIDEAPMNFQPGTNLTSAEDGAWEYDGTNLFFTVDPGNRGYVPVDNLIRLSANYTLTNTTAEQQLFNSTTNGRLTLELGTYDFRCSLGVNAMSATSGNASFDILGAGTAVLGTVHYRVVGHDAAAITTIAALSGSQNSAGQTAASMVTAATGVALQADIHGNFVISTAGTIVPSIDLVTAAAAVVVAGSYCRFTRIGDTTVSNVGQWD